MKRNNYTPYEEAVIVKVYVTNGGSRVERGRAASALCPNNSHSPASWNAQFGRLEALDNRNVKANKFVISSTLRHTAETLAPQLFV